MVKFLLYGFLILAWTLEVYALPSDPTPSPKPIKLTQKALALGTESDASEESAKRLFEKAKLFSADRRGYEAILLLRQLIRQYPDSPLAASAKISIQHIETFLRNYLQTEVDEARFFIEIRQASAARKRIDFIEKQWPEHPELDTLKNELENLLKTRRGR